MWRLIYAIPSWILFELIHIPLILLGWIVVPVAVLFKAYRIDVKMVGDNRSTGTAKHIWHFTWPWMFIWDNYEDGIYNDTYWKAPNDWMQIIYWSCLRNPTNNLRIVKYLSCKIDPHRVCFLGTFYNLSERGMDEMIYSYKERIEQYDTKVPHWFFAWQGLYSNYYWQGEVNGKLRRFWIGWKIFPTDVFGVTEYRKNGAGFAVQWKVVK